MDSLLTTSGFQKGKKGKAAAPDPVPPPEPDPPPADPIDLGASAPAEANLDDDFGGFTSGESISVTKATVSRRILHKVFHDIPADPIEQARRRRAKRGKW